SAPRFLTSPPRTLSVGWISVRNIETTVHVCSVQYGEPGKHDRHQHVITWIVVRECHSEAVPGGTTAQRCKLTPKVYPIVKYEAVYDNVHSDVYPNYPMAFRNRECSVYYIATRKGQSATFLVR